MSGFWITGWATISPHGRGRKAFLDAAPRSRGVPDFDVSEVLGAKGTRSINRVTALAIATVGDLLANTGCPTGEGTGLVLGTTTGSVESMMSFTRSSLTAERPYQVGPTLFPNTVMNCAAGKCAIWHDLRGPNTTIAGGRTTGLQALAYTGRLLRAGRAERVLVGAAEELSPARAWLAPGVPFTEGCAMLLVEPGAGMAEILSVRSRISPDGDIPATLRACVDGALDAASVPLKEIWAGSGIRLRGAKSLDGLAGEASSATAVFRIASVLAEAERTPARADRFALVTAHDADGSVSALVLRVAGSGA